MSRTEKCLAVIGAVYFVAGLIAFGHSASQTYKYEQAKYQECKVKEAADKRVYCFDSTTGSAGINGMIAGIFWPFYLSWELQS